MFDWAENIDFEFWSDVDGKIEKFIRHLAPFLSSYAQELRAAVDIKSDMKYFIA